MGCHGLLSRIWTCFVLKLWGMDTGLMDPNVGNGYVDIFFGQFTIYPSTVSILYLIFVHLGFLSVQIKLFDYT